MANCEFPKTFGKVSGTLTKQSYVTPDGIVTRRVVAQVRNGKQRIYIREDRPRSTKVTEAEIRQRNVFAAAVRYWMLVQKNDFILNVWANNFKRSPERKRYKTLSGYVRASAMKFYKAHPDKIDELMNGSADLSQTIC